MRKLKVLLTIGAISLCSIINAQEEQEHKLPPLEMLKGKPGEVKTIYELPDSTDYQVFNQLGDLVLSGHAEFINMTNFKKGTYFIVYDDKRERFVHAGKQKRVRK